MPVNTRMVPEKGLHLLGSSSSRAADFQDTLALFEQEPNIVAQLERIIGGVFDVRDAGDIATAFADDYGRSFGKTVLYWLV